MLAFYFQKIIPCELFLFYTISFFFSANLIMIFQFFFLIPFFGIFLLSQVEALCSDETACWLLFVCVTFIKCCQKGELWYESVVPISFHRLDYITHPIQHFFFLFIPAFFVSPLRKPLLTVILPQHSATFFMFFHLFNTSTFVNLLDALSFFLFFSLQFQCLAPTPSDQIHLLITFFIFFQLYKPFAIFNLSFLS